MLGAPEKKPRQSRGLGQDKVDVPEFSRRSGQSGGSYGVGAPH